MAGSPIPRRKVYFRAGSAQGNACSGHSEDGNYMVDHSIGIYILDTAGTPRLYVTAKNRSIASGVRDYGNPSACRFGADRRGRFVARNSGRTGSQGCADVGVCYLPQEQVVEVRLAGGSSYAPAAVIPPPSSWSNGLPKALRKGPAAAPQGGFR